MPKIKIYCLVLIIGSKVGTEVRVQADASMVTRWYIRGSYHPASITQSEFLNLFTDFRLQWTGVDRHNRCSVFKHLIRW